MRNHKVNQNDLLTYGWIFSFIASVMLLMATGENEYGFYNVLKIVVSMTSLMCAYIAYNYGAKVIVVPALMFAIIFNPFFIVAFEEKTWLAIDYFASVFFLAVGITFIWENKLLNKSTSGKTKS